MKTKRQLGFSAVETIVILVTVAILAGGAYLVFMRNNKDTNQKTYSTTNSAQTVPAVQKTSDLNAAEQTLDQTNVDDAGTDSAQLETLSNGF